MSISKTTIFNYAANLLGVKRVSVDTENTVVALTMSAAYDIARQDALRSIAPGFATSIQLLNLVANYTVPPGWLYGYQYPSNCLAMMRVYNNYTTGMSLDPITGRPFILDTDSMAKTPQQNFRKIFDTTLSVIVILSNVDTAYGEFIYDLNDASKFDASFVPGIGLRLAADTCVALTGDDAKATALALAFTKQYSETSRLDSYETEKQGGDSSIADSRG